MMRKFRYIARQVEFDHLENFLNEFAEVGFVVVSAIPSGMTIKEERKGVADPQEGSFKAETYNVIMAQYIGDDPNAQIVGQA